MKRILNTLVLMVLLVSGLQAHTYAPSSVLSSGKWVKIRVSESGVHRISYETLKEWGLQPEQVRIYGYGGALLNKDFRKKKIDDLPPVPFYIEKGADGVFGAGDYVLFYAQGTTQWMYDKQFVHTHNTYSDYGYYFLSDNAGEQLLIEPQRADLSKNYETSEVVKTYVNCQIHEKDIYNLLDTKGEDGGGSEWFGEQVSPIKPTQTFTFSISNPVEDTQLRYRMKVAASSSQTSDFVFKCNGSSVTRSIAPIPNGDYYQKAMEDTTNLYCTAKKGSNTLSMEFQSSVANASGYLDYIEMTQLCHLTFSGQSMAIRNSKATHFIYEMSQANSATQVWDITELDNIESVPTQLTESNLSWVSTLNNQPRVFIALDPKETNWPEPTLVGEVRNQNIHQHSNIDLVIITPAAYLAQAQQLANAHHENDAIEVLVVTDEEVYNEFSSGTPDASAYRWIMKMLYDRAGGAIEGPKSLLLMGDGSFDNRKLLINSGHNNRTLLLTYQASNSIRETDAYATDDYFGYLEDNDGIDSKGNYMDVLGTMEIGVGRLPVGTVDEAQNVVNKIIRYMKDEAPGNWKQQIVFLADDGNHGEHTITSERSAERVRLANPNFVVNKIFLDAYPQEVSAAGESYPLAKNHLDNLLRDGVLLFDYAGHGGFNNITNENMLDLRAIQKMQNSNMAFWIFVTCSFAHFDSGKSSAAEESVLNPKGGSIGILSACRTVYAAENTILNQHMCDQLFMHTQDIDYHVTIGEACRLAKNKTGKDKPRNINRLSYVLLADPALRLNYPTDYKVETTSQLDTVNALTIHKVSGKILDDEDQFVDNYNGKLNITIYDKLQQITTRDNDETNPAAQKVLTYNDYPGTIYNGETDIENGEFEFVFMTPKDIRYNYGKGRIVYYAHSPEWNADAVGHFEDFIVGGSSGTWLTDTVGPAITLFLNSPNFVNGGKTYETPRFYAILQDENGINMAGSGIGHDLMLTIDNDPTQAYIVNKYFTNDANTFKSGQVSYLLPTLDEGPHSLTFRAWDLLNNFSTATLNFEVVRGMDPNIYGLSSYVSAEGIMYVHVDYDQPDQNLVTELCIYNIQGQLLYTMPQDSPDNITVNLSDLNVLPGVYLYNVRIKSPTSSFVSRTAKIML